MHFNKARDGGVAVASAGSWSDGSVQRRSTHFL